MTVEQKNQILSLRKEGKTVREVSEITGFSIGNLSKFLKNYDPKVVECFKQCPNCLSDWPVSIIKKGFQKQYCCKKCRLEHYNKTKFRKKAVRYCAYCGKEFIAYTYKRTRYCSKSCAKRHQDEQRLQNKSR